MNRRDFIEGVFGTAVLGVAGPAAIASQSPTPKTFVRLMTSPNWVNGRYAPVVLPKPILTQFRDQEWISWRFMGGEQFTIIGYEVVSPRGIIYQEKIPNTFTPCVAGDEFCLGLMPMATRPGAKFSKPQVTEWINGTIEANV